MKKPLNFLCKKQGCLPPEYLSKQIHQRENHNFKMTLIFLLLLSLVYSTQGGAPGTSGDLNSPKLKELVENDAKQYLSLYGYMSMPKVDKAAEGKANTVEPSKYDLQTALQRFQKAFLIYRSGIVDVPTISKMNEYRCGNKDMSGGEDLQDLPKDQLWDKKVITWHISSFPTSLKEAQTREACDEAFEKWRQVAGIDFTETNDPKKADIVISFEDLPVSLMNVAAVGSRPGNSQIILDKSRIWGYRNHVPRGISLFHTLLHEIGHTLGLHHNFFRGSIMFPMLKPALVPYGTLDGVPNVDKLTLRKLYGLADVSEKKEGTFAATSKCPRQLDSVVQLTRDEWLLFLEDKVYKINNRKFVDTGKKIQDVFPKGPEFVNATVKSGNLLLLLTERTIYGYEYDGVTFTEAPDFPRELHELVLFYPQAAFPLTNGSVVLLSGNTFATYNVLENAPSFLNDKTRFYPNLPDGLRSGVPKDMRSGDAYWMFDETTVSDYDMPTKQVIQLDSILDFFKCT
ncbi:unnamed protein product [Cylicocyclus nassatus]|uniref:Peptidase metallopeptidase domain-containing protein n=1 Tax=Cylicocyclus nassatus TaxID=53992 RepID=A0AA36MDA7_CYLNA|nr:unnamed protein product [Cylicocyclus nassatus]